MFSSSYRLELLPVIVTAKPVSSLLPLSPQRIPTDLGILCSAKKQTNKTVHMLAFQDGSSRIQMWNLSGAAASQGYILSFECGDKANARRMINPVLKTSWWVSEPAGRCYWSAMPCLMNYYPILSPQSKERSICWRSSFPAAGIKDKTSMS